MPDYLSAHVDVNGTNQPGILGRLEIQGDFDPAFGIQFVGSPAAWINMSAGGMRLQTLAEYGDHSLQPADGCMVFVYFHQGPGITNLRWNLRFLLSSTKKKVVANDIGAAVEITQDPNHGF